MAEEPGIALVPVDYSLIATVGRWVNSPRNAHFDDYGPRSDVEFERALRHRIITEKCFIIESGGQPIGYLGYVPLTPMVLQFRGIVIDPVHRGNGFGPAAMKLAIKSARQQGFEKFIVETFAHNEAANRMIFRCGGVREGVRRNATRQNGKLIDMIIWSME